MKKIREAIGWILIGFGVGGFIFIFIDKFANPDMTEMRYFIENWKHFAVTIAFVIGGQVLIYWGDNED